MKRLLLQFLLVQWLLTGGLSSKEVAELEILLMRDMLLNLLILLRNATTLVFLDSEVLETLCVFLLLFFQVDYLLLVVKRLLVTVVLRFRLLRIGTESLVLRVVDLHEIGL